MDTIISIPTDGGKAWSVVLLAFCQNFVKEAIPYTFLILTSKNKFEDQLFHFFIGGLFYGLTYILCPISCALANWYSFKTLSVVAPCILALTNLASFYCIQRDERLLYMVAFGFFGGFGNSLLHACSKLMPSYWFCNRRSLAHAFAQAGHTLGFIVITNVTVLLVHQAPTEDPIIYIIFSSLYFLLFFFGFLAPKQLGTKVYYSVGHESDESNKRQVRFKDEVEASCAAENPEQLNKDSVYYKIFKTHHNLTFPRVKDIIGSNDVTIFVPDPIMQNVLRPPNTRWSLGNNARVLDEDRLEYIVAGRQTVKIVLHSPDVEGFGSRPMYRIDILYTWDLRNLRIYSRQDDQLDFHLAMTRAMSLKDLNQEKHYKWWRCLLPEAIIRTLITMLDIRIYRDVYMTVLFVNVFLIVVGQSIPFIFLINRCLEVGCGERAFHLVTYTGLGQLLARMLIGALGTFATGADFYVPNIFLLITGGLVTILACFCQTRPCLIGYSIIYGGIYASTQTLRLTAIYTISKMSNLTNTMGHTFLWQGVGVLCAVTLSGFLYTKYEKTLYVLILAALTMISAGILLIITKAAKACSRRNAFISA